MVRTNSRTQTLREAANAQARHRLRTSAVLAAVVGGAALHMAQYLIKTPMYTSALTGEQWTKELLDGHWERFHNMMGMNKRVFRKLNQELEKYSGFKGSRYIGQEEQLAMFLYMCRSGAVHREVRERFQHSPGTITRYTYQLKFLTVANDSLGCSTTF